MLTTERINEILDRCKKAQEKGSAWEHLGDQLAHEDVPALLAALAESTEIIRAQDKVISNSTKANDKMAKNRDRWKARCEELERVINQPKVNLIQQTDATCPNCGASFLVDVPV